MTFHFKPKYVLLTLLFFITEVLIAVFVHDGIVRPYLGDVIVVLLIYCFLRSFIALPVYTAAVAVFIFACCIEGLQYLKIIQWLGIESSSLARTVIGTSFSWIDMLTYLTGFLIILGAESLGRKKS